VRRRSEPHPVGVAANCRDLLAYRKERRRAFAADERVVDLTKPPDFSKCTDMRETDTRSRAYSSASRAIR